MYGRGDLEEAAGTVELEVLGGGNEEGQEDIEREKFIPLSSDDMKRRSNVGEEKASSMAAFANMTNSFFGSGVLGLPFAFKNAGTWAGAITLILIACAAHYCIQILLRCQDIIREQQKRRATENERNSARETEQEADMEGEGDGHYVPASYGEIGEAAFGPRGKTAVDSALVFTQMGFCCIYMIFLSTNLNDIFPSVSKTTFVWTIFLMLSAICMVRSLKWLAPFSVVAELSTVVGLLITNFYAVVSLVHKLGNGDNYRHDISAFRPLTYPMFFGVASATYEGIANVIPIQRSMKNPREYPTVLRRTFFFITTVFLISGLTSYIGFGQETKSIITLNLPGGAVGETVKFILCIAIFFTYPIQLFVVFDILESNLFRRETTATAAPTISQVPTVPLSNAPHPSDNLLLQYCTPLRLPVRFFLSLSNTTKVSILRICLVLFTALVAYLVPHFGEVIGLLGSIGCPVLAYILPIVFFTKLNTTPLDWRRKYAHILIVAVGVIGGIISALDVFLEEEE